MRYAEREGVDLIALATHGRSGVQRWLHGSVADAVLHSVKPGALGVAEELAVLSTIARLATYIGTCLAVPVLRRKMPATPRTIRLPGGPVIPIAALVICLMFLSAAEKKHFIGGAIALAFGALVYASRGKSAAERSARDNT